MSNIPNYAEKQYFVAKCCFCWRPGSKMLKSSYLSNFGSFAVIISFAQSQCK